MTNTDFIVREKGGINHLTLHPGTKTEELRLTITDGALMLGFLAIFVGLVFLLAK